MTMPSETITVRCGGCGHEFQDWVRRSVNLDLDPWAAEGDYLERASSVTCPACGWTAGVGTLVVAGDVWEWR